MTDLHRHTCAPAIGFEAIALDQTRRAQAWRQEATKLAERLHSLHDPIGTGSWTTCDLGACVASREAFAELELGGLV